MPTLLRYGLRITTHGVRLCFFHGRFFHTPGIIVSLPTAVEVVCWFEYPPPAVIVLVRLWLRCGNYLFYFRSELGFIGLLAEKPGGATKLALETRASVAAGCVARVFCQTWRPTYSRGAITPIALRNSETELMATQFIILFTKLYEDPIA
jgi:hypothetical protein